MAAILALAQAWESFASFLQKSRPYTYRGEGVMIYAGVVLLGTVLASVTDWLFFDVLVHRFYASAPNVWRPGGRLRIAVSQAVGTLATAAAVALAVLVHGNPVILAALIWSAGPLPATLQNMQWMRIHPAVGASHAAGWLVRLLIATLLAAWLL